MLLPGFVDVGDAKLRCVTEGRGTDCLVIGSSVYYPRTFSANLRRHLRLTFVDMRWFAKGARPDPSGGFTIDTIVADIERVRRAMKLERFVLMGHSIHGSVAFEYAKRHPSRVLRLVMIGAPVVYGNAEYDAATETAWQVASPERQAMQADNWAHPERFQRVPRLPQVAEDYLAMAPKYWANPRYDARWLWTGVEVQPNLIRRLYGELFRDYAMFGKKRAVPVPTFVAVGKYDAIVPVAQWLPFAGIPNLTLCQFLKSGHTPQLEEPGRFDRELLSWLKK